ncbi:hypothetical protein DFS34DRAFT_630286 [Phlyctochytrium arcticum]|nr:hypothetical protein DFS34DRAFT_630286 [Phlyctochytrium arcticum]
MATIDIPIGQSGEVLEVSRRDLKENEDFVFTIMSDEAVPLSVYVDIALEYFKQGLKSQFEEVVKLGLRRAAREEIPTEKRHYVLLLNLLASYYVEVAKSRPPSSPSGDTASSKEQYILKATELLNEALALGNQDVYTIVASGNIRLARKEYEAATNSFSGALARDANCVPALLGQAAVLCQKKLYTKGLELYQKVLSLKPDIVPDVRVPIGICYLNVGAFGQARRAFERALSLNPNNADALILLSIMDWNECRGSTTTTSDDKAHLPDSSNGRLIEAFNIEKQHPLVLAQFAQRKLIRKEYDECIKFADMAAHATDSRAIRAEMVACKAKAYHARGRYREALKLYEESIELDPQTSVMYGLALMQIEAGQLENACDMLEKLLQKDPLRLEVILRLISLYALVPSRRNNMGDLLDRLKKASSPAAHDLNANHLGFLDLIDDAHVLVDIAHGLEASNPKRALNVYHKCLEQLETKNAEIPLELYNNIAALYHILGEELEGSTTKQPVSGNPKISEAVTNGTTIEIMSRDQLFEQAEIFYKKAIEGSQGSISDTTIQYNLARLMEARGQVEDAKLAYEKLLDVAPAYTDSRLRLGVLLCDQGRYNDAIDALRLVADSDPKDIRSRLLIGNAYLLAGNKLEAKRSYDAILKNIDNQNLYALCALGDLQVNLARSAARRDPKERDELLVRSHRLYDAALKKDQKNIYAVMGMGLLFIEKGLVNEAYNVFTQIEQATGSLPCVSMNLAHSFLTLDEKDARVAIPLYEKAIRKGYAQDPYALQALARAYYILARERKDDASMQTSLRIVEKAARLNPQDASIFFNLALVKQHMAVVLNDQPIERRDLGAMHRAMDGIDAAEKIFTALSARTPDSRPNYNITHATHRKTYCKDVRKLSEKKIHETSTLERQREERKERIREEQRAREEEKQRKEAEEKERKRKHEEELAARRAEIQARLQEDMARVRQMEANEKEDENRKRKGRKREAAAALSEEEGDDNEEKRRRPKKKSSSRKDRDAEHPDTEPKSDDLFGSDDDGSSNSKKPRRIRKRGLGLKSDLSNEFVASDSDDGTSGLFAEESRTEPALGDLSD